MKNKGFVLVDVLVGLFFIGLVSVLSLPLLSSSYSNYGSIKARTEMNYLGESIYERLCAKDEYSSELIEKLNLRDEVIFEDLDDYYLEKYHASVVNLNNCESFLDIKIVIKSNADGGNVSDVEFKGGILR